MLPPFLENAEDDGNKMETGRTAGAQKGMQGPGNYQFRFEVHLKYPRP